MKTIIPFSTFLVLSCFLSIAQFTFAQKQSKIINKTFQISKGDILEIENKFGDIDILQWDKPEVSVSVMLNASSKNDATAKSMIEKISIKTSKENSTIKAETILNNESGMTQGNSFSVNYTVYAPKWVNLTLNNKFGNIHIDDVSGLVNISLKHGNLIVKSLERGNLPPLNEITMAYSNGTIDNAGFIILDLSNSKLEFEDVGSIVAETKYSGINAVNCNSLKTESKYDILKFDNIRNLEGTLQYSNLHLGEFSGRFDLESSYSIVKIDQVLPSFESVKITNSRGAYKIGIDPETSFDLYGNSERGDINVREFNVLEKKTNGTSKSVHAVNGTEGTGKTINVSVEEGSVSLFRN